MSVKSYIVPLVLLMVVPVLPWTYSWKVGENTCNSVFGVVGVLFSVEMSLIIAFNTRGVSDQSMKARLRKDMGNIRNVIIGYFVLSFVVLLLLKHMPDYVKLNVFEHYLSSCVNMRLAYISFLSWYIIVLLYNFYRIHKNYERLEDVEG